MTSSKYIDFLGQAIDGRIAHLAFGLQSQILQYKQQIDESVTGVKMDISSIYQEHENLKEAYRQLQAYYEKMASTKEGDDMSEQISSKLGIVENDVKHLGESVSRIEANLNRVIDKIDNISSTMATRSELEKVSDKIENLVTKEQFNEATQRTRFTVTTWIALASAAGSIIAAIIAYVK
ncbi:hypothetical protein DNH61_11840 [Paenibacillus sambharensis]|uniref:Uncharacterized protein n=1 Tax=Paenibacillus sambharensis TaxID=1803190 RepID=A0A2W1LL71_9BACL|nr:hypothetical protein [Paenibacillus sambharensis]PZD95244.1 hypothetical protein DNH61_11840 [Paenibacillus sambharensis]